MIKISLKQDTLNQENVKFKQHDLRVPVFLNSVPKCGTHLIRNIFRMFVPVHQQFHDTFIQMQNLKNSLHAFDPNNPKLSWGHLLATEQSMIVTQTIAKYVLVRDPYDWVLARTRFLLSESHSQNSEEYKSGNINLDRMLNLMIFGINGKIPPMRDVFTYNAVAWLGIGAKIVKYEDIMKNLKNLNTVESEIFFKDLLLPLLFDDNLPNDWRERVLIGSDPKQSGTHRDNLFGTKVELPEELPDAQKRLVEYAAPDLRRILGYC